jgi:hypothetical protein
MIPLAFYRQGVKSFSYADCLFLVAKKANRESQLHELHGIYVPGDDDVCGEFHAFDYAFHMPG